MVARMLKSKGLYEYLECARNVKEKYLQELIADYKKRISKYAKIELIELKDESNKINENGTEFKQGEIAKIKDRYKLSPKDVDSIFFSK